MTDTSAPRENTVRVYAGLGGRTLGFRSAADPISPMAKQVDAALRTVDEIDRAFVAINGDVNLSSSGRAAMFAKIAPTVTAAQTSLAVARASIVIERGRLAERLRSILEPPAAGDVLQFLEDQARRDWFAGLPSAEREKWSERMIAGGLEDGEVASLTLSLARGPVPDNGRQIGQLAFKTAMEKLDSQAIREISVQRADAIWAQEVIELLLDALRRAEVRSLEVA